MVLKVLIVDDEVLVRCGLRTMIAWEEYGFEVVGEAPDGEKALHLAQETHPDIVLTDLIMPKLSGIELIRELQHLEPNTKIIVLSCHNDYESVRESMQMKNTIDYLFKLVMQPQEILDVLLKTKQLILEEQKNRESTKNYEELLFRNRVFEFGRFLSNQLRDKVLKPNIELANAQPLFSLPAPPYAVITLIVSNGCTITPIEENVLLVLVEIQLKANLIASISAGVYCVLIAQTPSSEQPRLVNSLRKIIDSAGQQNLSVHYGLSFVENEREVFRDAYIQAHAQAAKTALPLPESLSDVQKAIAYLHEHYRENIKLTVLADYVHLNEAYLSSIIKRDTGTSFTEILNQIRVDAAKNLLANTSLSVETISDQTGFSSWSYFSRVFKKICEISPADYRRKSRKKNSNKSKEI